MKQKISRNKIFQIIIWIFEGILVGIGAILPGISGGTLCVAFGMYRPILELLNDIKGGIKKHFLMFLSFFIGVFIGFVGLSGAVDKLMQMNPSLITFIFVGFIVGTIPELFSEAGERGRNKFSYISIAVALAVMLPILLLLNTSYSFSVEPSLLSFALCGAIWGLSFIVPGLSSSSLILLIGLYQPMNEGISHLRPSVILPLGVAMVITVLLLGKVMNILLDKAYSIVTHAVIGFVISTVIMLIINTPLGSGLTLFFNFLGAILGCIASFFFTILCGIIKKRCEVRDEPQKKKRKKRQ